MGERRLFDWVEHGQLINDSLKIYQKVGRSEGGKESNNTCAVVDFLLTLGRHLILRVGYSFRHTRKSIGFSNKFGGSEGRNTLSG